MKTGSHLCWDQVTGIPVLGDLKKGDREGALVPDISQMRDQVAVVYNKGETPPEITISDVSGSVQTVLADGIAVAVIATADGPALSAEDVLLVERHC